MKFDPQVAGPSIRSHRQICCGVVQRCIAFFKQFYLPSIDGASLRGCQQTAHRFGNTDPPAASSYSSRWARVGRQVLTETRRGVRRSRLLVAYDAKQVSSRALPSPKTLNPAIHRNRSSIPILKRTKTWTFWWTMAAASPCGCDRLDPRGPGYSDRNGGRVSRLSHSGRSDNWYLSSLVGAQAGYGTMSALQDHALRYWTPAVRTCCSPIFQSTARSQFIMQAPRMVLLRLESDHGEFLSPALRERELGARVDRDVNADR